MKINKFVKKYPEFDSAEYTIKETSVLSGGCDYSSTATYGKRGGGGLHLSARAGYNKPTTHVVGVDYDTKTIYVVYGTPLPREGER